MRDIWFIILFAVLALAVTCIVNAVVAVLSGEHPRDTIRIWLDDMIGWIGDLVPAGRPTSIRLLYASVATLCVMCYYLWRIYGS